MAQKMDCGTEGSERGQKEVPANPLAHPTRAAVFAASPIGLPSTIAYSAASSAILSANYLP
ncbi:hypothetical protein BT69DRAFT_1285074 [Atractiella rhizophila]|nr:hypothetical protein BT69DRAFT_1285074 [Atractiella rhizophila]